MKLYRVFLIALMTSAFAVVGCGDSGGGGQSASEVRDACDNSNLKGACESAYNTCVAADPGGKYKRSALQPASLRAEFRCRRADRQRPSRKASPVLTRSRERPNLTACTVG